MFFINPYEAVGPIRFGMTRAELVLVVGDPVRELKNRRAEADLQFPGFSIRLSKGDEKVVEVGITPDTPVMLCDVDVFVSADAFARLVKIDGAPYEYVGFVILLNLGVTMTGFHDADESQKAITVFEKGRWDHLRSQFNRLPIA
ncbi:hypothetical protein ACAX43_21020 [Paraburkholderia sp. IW21]|uniref:hypothetical protein n=1 Tax=Paraburkholderia sp. IW21 TaxID=3242488 RepID=UPI003520D113